MRSVFSGEPREKMVDNLASFDLSGLEFKLKPDQEDLHEGSGLLESTAKNVEVEYNGIVMVLESIKREAFFDDVLVNESYEFRLKSDSTQILVCGLIIDFSPDVGGLPVAETIIKKSEVASQKAEFKKLGVLFSEKLFIFLEDLAKKRSMKMLSKAKYGPKVSDGKLSFEDWKKIFVPLFEKMGYVQTEGQSVWQKKLG